MSIKSYRNFRKKKVGQTLQNTINAIMENVGNPCVTSKSPICMYIYTYIYTAIDVCIYLYTILLFTTLVYFPSHLYIYIYIYICIHTNTCQIRFHVTYLLSFSQFPSSNNDSAHGESAGRTGFECLGLYGSRVKIGGNCIAFGPPNRFDRKC